MKRPSFKQVQRVNCTRITAGLGFLLIGIFWFVYDRNIAWNQEQELLYQQDSVLMHEVVQVLHENSPRVLYWPNFLSEEECDKMVPQLERSQVATPDKNDKNKEKAHVNDVRTSSGAWLSKSSWDSVATKFTRSLPKSHGEDIQFLRYEIGQEYKPHYDFFDPAVYEEFLKNGGQRAASVLCFLNDVEEGGETIFPRINLKVKPQKGAAILWINSVNGTIDRMSEHGICLVSLYNFKKGGSPVKKGVKYVAVQWMREKPRSSFM